MMRPARRERIRRNRRGISGESDRSSTTTNAVRRTTPTTADATATPESQPAVGASTSANTIAIVAVTKSERSRDGSEYRRRTTSSTKEPDDQDGRAHGE